MKNSTTATELLISLKSLSKGDLESIKGVGSVLADNYVEFLESERYENLVNKFDKIEAESKSFEVSYNNINSLSKDTKGIIVITGKFDQSRSEIKKQLELKGYKIGSSINKSVDYLLHGSDPGSKLVKAESLGIKTISNISDL